jgi:hypothetical protein
MSILKSQDFLHLERFIAIPIPKHAAEPQAQTGLTVNSIQALSQGIEEVF